MNTPLFNGISSLCRLLITYLSKSLAKFNYYTNMKFISDPGKVAYNTLADENFPYGAVYLFQVTNRLQCPVSAVLPACSAVQTLIC